MHGATVKYVADIYWWLCSIQTAVIKQCFLWTQTKGKVSP